MFNNTNKYFKNWQQTSRLVYIDTESPFFRKKTEGAPEGKEAPTDTAKALEQMEEIVDADIDEIFKEKKSDIDAFIASHPVTLYEPGNWIIWNTEFMVAIGKRADSDERNQAVVRDFQRFLKKRGLYKGTIDGQLGTNTTSAIASYSFKPEMDAEIPEAVPVTEQPEAVSKGGVPEGAKPETPVAEAPKASEPAPEAKPKVRPSFREFLAEPAENIGWEEDNIDGIFSIGRINEYAYHTKREGAWIDLDGNRLDPEKVFAKIKETGPTDPTGNLGFSPHRNYGIRGLDGVLRYFNQDGEEVRAANSLERVREIQAGVALEKATEEQKKIAFEKFKKGKAEYEKENYKKAFPILRESYKEVASPNTHFMITYCLFAMGYESEAMHEAMITFRETKADAKKYSTAAEETQKLLAKLKPGKEEKESTQA